MKGGIVVLAIMKPLKRPSAVPITIAAITDCWTESPLFTMNPALRVPESARIDPTERSIPPVIIANVIPNARQAFDDT